MEHPTVPPAVSAPFPGSPPQVCQIAFANMDASEPPRAEVRAWLQKLAPLTGSLMGGRVLIEAIDDDQPQRHDRRQERRERKYRVRVDLTMPHGTVVVGHDHPSNGAHEDVYVAIRNAFRGARRELERYSQARAEAAVDPAPAVA
jgi:ribosome-associated translation inhibitor RaiA